MDRLAVVTGAARGLGFETARQLAGRGLRVVVTDRTLEDARAAAARIEGEVEAAACDVSSAASIEAFLTGLAERELTVDVLVNNAGAILSTIDRARLDLASGFTVSRDTVIETFTINTAGAYRLMQALIPGMRERGYGRVVNVSSGMGALATMGAGWPGYRMSKAALNAATRVFAAEAGPHVKVNAVCPGWVKTTLGGGDAATRSIEDGVAGIVWAATLPDDGPTGGFFRDGEPIDW